MKKLVLFAVAVVFAGMVNAQDCTPLIDAAAPLVGLNPNPPAGSIEGVPYDEVNTLVIPKSVDNTLTAPVGDSIVLCAVEILGIINMPVGYGYEAWAFHAGPGSSYDVLAQATDTIHIFQTTFTTKICIRLKNPSPPASSDMGDGLPAMDTAYVQIAVGAWADLFGCTSLVLAGGTDTFEVHIPIKDAIYIGVEENDVTLFEVDANYPNPASDITYLNFTTPKASEVNINVYDAVGRSVYNFTGNSNVGKNTFGLATTDLKDGIYIYSITYKGKTISKKLIVSK